MPLPNTDAAALSVHADRCRADRLHGVLDLQEKQVLTDVLRHEVGTALHLQLNEMLNACIWQYVCVLQGNPG